MPLVKHTYNREASPVYVSAVTLTEAKAHLNITNSYDDTMITSLCMAASKLCEEWTWRAFVDSDFLLYLSEIPVEFYICKCPINTITSVKYYDTSEVLTTLVNGTDYIIGLESEPAVLRFLTSPNLSTKKIYPVLIEMNSGWATEANVPQQIKQAILICVANMYEMRTDNIVGVSSTEIPMPSKMLLANQRVNIY
jgi:uncharacterized phiE125 gp8 family phage protein